MGGMCCKKKASRREVESKTAAKSETKKEGGLEADVTQAEETSKVVVAKKVAAEAPPTSQPAILPTRDRSRQIDLSIASLAQTTKAKEAAESKMAPTMIPKTAALTRTTAVTAPTTTTTARGQAEEPMVVEEGGKTLGVAAPSMAFPAERQESVLHVTLSRPPSYSAPTQLSHAQPR